MGRIPVIAGNWKMNTSPEEGVRLTSELKARLSGLGGVEVIIAPPFTHLCRVADAICGCGIKLAAQNVHQKYSGAFTGEISAAMLKEVGCAFVIVGHSERRQYFGETDGSVNEKLHAVLHHDMTPMICVGETLGEREAGRALEVIGRQVEGGLDGLKNDGWRDIIVAYEPVWAIGTGKTATEEQAQEVHCFIRGRLGGLFGEDVASRTRILYGGSVKPDNIDGIMAKPDIDGALVGGASLRADSFERIAKFRRD